MPELWRREPRTFQPGKSAGLQTLPQKADAHGCTPMLPLRVKPPGTTGPISAPASCGATGTALTRTFTPTARNVAGRPRGR
ncbi:hypothetical protein [Nonomuraea typhae]|uniref:hypothetical protein n=1 Tax=Nonomuraea typhae TaxID=2603600 RepID=UPI0012F9D4CD|nr:hypothetical protein [Nonomuraea typhae]